MFGLGQQGKQIEYKFNLYEHKQNLPFHNPMEWQFYATAIQLDQQAFHLMIRNKISVSRCFSSAKQWVESHSYITEKVAKLAKMIKGAKHPLLFTGAGCSTSIGIPDYRSGEGTIVQTGPGIWNRKKQQTPPKLRIDEIVDRAVPSLTHMAIKTLLDKNIFRHLVSQNTDGLHLRSGVRYDKISQLHGNRNLEKCLKCSRKYFRDFRTIRRDRKPQQPVDHKTGRSCENCGGDLVDSIIYFGEKLSAEDLRNALDQAARCDLLLCVGSSLTVKPSANVPILALRNNSNVCIINIQQTPFDEVAQLKINGFCDSVFKQLMNELNFQIDPFKIEHYLEMEIINGEAIISGKDQQRNNFTFIKSLTANNIEYDSVGHCVRAPVDHSTHEVRVNFYGSKAPLTLYLPAYYKLYHGQQVRLKISKQHSGTEWDIQQF